MLHCLVDLVLHVWSKSIEQVHFNHTDGRLFTEAVLNRFDLRESQNAIYKNNIVKLSTAPTCLNVLYGGVRIFIYF